ncbi:hypothetical protein CPB84DRAFT_1760087 [Gymnopilus junonius]|uniref:Uncharacterized protein n=1 Tax=Gymnopilus junonius TaxID=109634 RepID=A0A9P5P104_GYMJU|nr:hypothetical protein CPB84DRAFT_1760087 [Gymnopilus junonius]
MSRDHHDRLRILLDQRSSHCSDTPSLYSPTAFSPRPSLHLHDHHPSMLDLDDNPPSSSPSDVRPQSPYEDDSDLENPSRMSYLGPKMRFHSRAPWELEDNTLHQAPEVDDNNPRHFTSGFPFGRATGQRPSTPGSSSPRPSFSSRPSVDSSSSHVPPKRSFETINSQISYPRGALYALAQESLSTNSLARGSARPKETLKSKFSLGRLRPEPEAPTAPLPPSPIQGRFHSLRGNEQPKHSFEANPSNPHDLYINKSRTTLVKESMHPYANPDLVSSYSEDQEFVDDEHSMLNYTPPPRHDSVITVTESFSTGSIVKSVLRPIQSPDGPSSSKSRTVSIQAKNISSPVSVVVPTRRTDLSNGNTTLPPGVNSLPGWTERNTPPTFSLISLEEARAQRTKTSTANVSSRMSISSGASNSSTPFPAGAASHMLATEPSTFATRARGRSISAGAKAKNAIQTIVGQPKPERRDSEPGMMALQSSSGPPGKTLKHKKSGFMRLFNGGKTQDKDVPSISPSLSELAGAQSGDSLMESHSWKTNLGQKRLPPTLSINTIHESSSRSSTSAVAERPIYNTLHRPWQDEQPQSAPPNISEFPALKLRPVSTLFSAFSDHLVAIESRTSAETVDTDVITPRSPSPNEVISPVTPSSYSRISQDQLPVISMASGDESTVKSLQEQLVSARTTWQRQIWELEGQVRDLKAELEEVKGRNGGDEYCDTCGRGKKPLPASSGGSVVNRPRARTATSTRFGHPLP